MDAFEFILLGVIFWSVIMLAYTLVNLKGPNKDKEKE